jgi:hypothetical protein
MLCLQMGGTRQRIGQCRAGKQKEHNKEDAEVAPVGQMENRQVHFCHAKGGKAHGKDVCHVWGRKAHNKDDLLCLLFLQGRIHRAQGHGVCFAVF